MKTFLYNATLVSDGVLTEKQGVLVEDGVIVAITDTCPADAQKIDLDGDYLTPTFVDLHCHGGGGFEFYDATEEAIVGMCKMHAEHGTGVLYPTLSASNYETTYKSLEALEMFKDKAPIYIPGAHLEGPYLSPLMCGAQDPGIVRKPNEEEYRGLYERFGELISRWDYAPEEDENCRFAEFLSENGIVSSTAHSAAKYSHLLPAFEKGNRLVTHLFSCTSTVTREGGFRKLGVIETTFLLDDMYAEVIGDGCHLPAELMNMIYKIKGADKLCLITDAIRFAGIPAEDGTIWDAGGVPYLVEDGVAKLVDRSAFAGSIATTDVLLKRTVEAGIPLAQTVKMLTETPARVMGLDEYGRIAVGYRAVFNRVSPELAVTPLKP